METGGQRRSLRAGARTTPGPERMHERMHAQAAAQRSSQDLHFGDRVVGAGAVVERERAAEQGHQPDAGRPDVHLHCRWKRGGRARQLRSADSSSAAPILKQQQRRLQPRPPARLSAPVLPPTWVVRLLALPVLNELRSHVDRSSLCRETARGGGAWGNSTLVHDQSASPPRPRQQRAEARSPGASACA